MPINPRLLIAAVTALCACALLAPARSLRGAESPTQGVSAAALIEKLGLHVTPQPVRERLRWHSPRIVLGSPELHELLPPLHQAAPHAKLTAMRAASAR